MLRRAMGKKKPEEMAKQRAGFMEGCAANGIDKDLAGNLFDLVEKFAGYGFNKSHSAAYALVSYQTAWLKAHYPAPVHGGGDVHRDGQPRQGRAADRRVSQLGTDGHAARRQRGQLQVHRRRAGRVVYGLGAIRGVGEGPIGAIVEAREADGAFSDLFDFCRRVDANA